MPEPLAGRRLDARPLLSDYLSDAEMDRLAEVLIGLLVATEQARMTSTGRDRTAAESPPTHTATRR